MGLRTKYAGAIGNDANGQRITRELAQRGVDVEHVVVRQAANPFAVILLDERQGERVVLWDRDPKLQLDAGEIEAALAAPARLLHVDDADEDAAIRTAHHGRRAGIPVTSDIERVTEGTEDLVAAVSIPIFAEHALQMFTGERDFERALRKVSQQRIRFDDLVCVTLGARGAMLLEGDRVHLVDGHHVDVVDTTGAGDVFRGAFIVALLRGDPPADILRFANAAAAISCTRLGATNSVPSVEDVNAVLRT
jgi:sugar/nucleoside kinase (ribokinase family)